ncbi:MAG: hypothetical protein LBL77_03240 [Endomicrobium sp.]|jgi:hypothetical protein|nr:hypothetical protein [Endomicrobium sp.]
MSLYDVKRVQIFSILKILPLVFLILGCFIGLFTFFFFPTDLTIGLSFSSKLLSLAIFAMLYTIIMIVGIILVALLYNFLTAMLKGGIVFSLEHKE